MRKKLPISAGEVERLIHEIARSKDRITISRHAAARMRERLVRYSDVLRTLCSGAIIGTPVPGAAKGELKCRMSARVRTFQSVIVVTIMIDRTELLVKTVMWDDRH